MSPRKGCRKGVQLLEMMLVLPIIGIVLTVVALSIAGSERAFDSVRQQSLDVATLGRLAQQFREDVHRATEPPSVSEEGLEIARPEGIVRYQRSGDQLIRLFEPGGTSRPPGGSSRATFAISLATDAWEVDRRRGVARLKLSGPEGGEILAAWSPSSSRSSEVRP